MSHGPPRLGPVSLSIATLASAPTAMEFRIGTVRTGWNHGRATDQPTDRETSTEDGRRGGHTRSPCSALEVATWEGEGLGNGMGHAEESGFSSGWIELQSQSYRVARFGNSTSTAGLNSRGERWLNQFSVPPQFRRGHLPRGDLVINQKSVDQLGSRYIYKWGRIPRRWALKYTLLCIYPGLP
jgi:hypothetical protein